MDELRRALELATDEELQDLTEILFRPKFNPLDYVLKLDPLDVQSRDRQEWLDAIEQRFRFLAADGMTVLSRRSGTLSYRQILIGVCRYLRLPYQQSMSTTDLEAEVFLNLLGRALKQMSDGERDALRIRLRKSLTRSQILPQLPTTLQHNPLRLLVEGGGAVAVSAVLRPLLLQHIARQFAIHMATYQAAQQAARLGGAAVANYLTLQTAKQGMALATARYATVRGALSILGPAMWAWFFADLGWRAVATNYSRVIPTIYALAQIRLTRSDDLYFEMA